jgi:hypothetical protein
LQITLASGYQVGWMSAFGMTETGLEGSG